MLPFAPVQPLQTVARQEVAAPILLPKEVIAGKIATVLQAETPVVVTLLALHREAAEVNPPVVATPLQAEALLQVVAHIPLQAEVRHRQVALILPQVEARRRQAVVRILLRVEVQVAIQVEVHRGVANHRVGEVDRINNTDFIWNFELV